MKPHGQRQPLHPLWMERQRVFESMNELGIAGLPSWRDLEIEAERYLTACESGALPWPPPNAPFAGGVLERWEDFVRTKQPFSLTNFMCFTLLPPIQRILLQQQRILTLSGAPHEMVSRFVAITLNQAYHLAMWERFGGQAYVIDPLTFDLLAHTSLPKVPARMLSFPKQSFFVRFPEGRYRFSVVDDPSPQPVEGVLVAIDSTDSERVRDISVLLVGKSRLGAADDNCLFGGFRLAPDQLLSTFTPTVEGDKARFLPPDAWDLTDLAVRSVLNLALYLQSRHPLLEPVPPAPRRDLSAIRNRAKLRKAESQNNRLSRYGYLYVGGRPQASSASASSSADGRSWSLDHQVSVRPHWRNQARGPGRKERELIWIEEHVRGPDLADAMGLRIDRVQGARLRDGE